VLSSPAKTRPIATAPGRGRCQGGPISHRATTTAISGANTRTIPSRTRHSRLRRARMTRPSRRPGSGGVAAGAAPGTAPPRTPPGRRPFPPAARQPQDRPLLLVAPDAQLAVEVADLAQAVGGGHRAAVVQPSRVEAPAGPVHAHPLGEGLAGAAGQLHCQPV